MVGHALLVTGHSEKIAELRIIVAENDWAGARLGFKAADPVHITLPLLPKRIQIEGDAQLFGDCRERENVACSRHPRLQIFLHSDLRDVVSTGRVRWHGRRGRRLGLDGCSVDLMQLGHASTDPGADNGVAHIVSSECSGFKVFFYTPILKSTVDLRPDMILRREEMKSVKLSWPRDERRGGGSVNSKE